MSSHWEDRPQSNNHVTLPRNNVDWAEAIVKWTRYDHVDMYDYPTTNNSETVMQIYKGDMVQVSRRYRREDWCLCQVGHVLGWVFLQDVRFIVEGAKSPRPQRGVEHTQTISPSTSDIDTAPPSPLPHFNDEDDAYELRTEPAVRQTILKPEDGEEDDEPSAYAEKHREKKPLINRLIGFFKR